MEASLPEADAFPVAVTTLRIGAIAPRTECEGPGVRLALWVQGCAIRCPGCCNPQFFAARGGREVAVAELVAELRAAAPGIEGVTFLGGEPFEQAAALASLAREARALGLSVMTFSGHRLEDLRARGDAGVAALLDATDVLVDGPYDATRPEPTRRWVGSTNQRFHFLSARYAPGIERPAPGEPQRRIEIEITPEGTVQLRGWPELARL
jgi:anaerobic ribonucleoside-triphosphate reductase activating protein